MAYPVTKLITGAYYLSSIVSKGLEKVSGEQLRDGLDLLNELLEFKQIDSSLIPYFKSYDFTFIPAHEDYFFPDLIEVDTITFDISTVRFPTQSQQRKRYAGTPRANNVNSLPYNWRLEREQGGARIYFYPKPVTNYPATLWGKFGLTNVTKTTDLDLHYDRFYIGYLRYALSEKICAENNITLQPQVEAQLNEFENKLIKVNPPDLSMTKLSSFGDRSSINYGYVNFPSGFSP